MEDELRVRMRDGSEDVEKQPHARRQIEFRVSHHWVIVSPSTYSITR